MQFSTTQLTAIRKQLQRYSYRKLSRQTNITISDLYQAQSNQDRDYRVSTLEKYAAMLNIPVWYFLFLADLDSGKISPAVRNALANQYSL